MANKLSATERAMLRIMREANDLYMDAEAMDARFDVKEFDKDALRLAVKSFYRKLHRLYGTTVELKINLFHLD